MTDEKGLFWQDLDRDLENPQFRAEFLLQSIRIATFDRLINELNDARLEQDLTKAALARAIGSDSAVVRRLFSAHSNPTLGTLSEIAAALGMEVTLTPLPKEEAKIIANMLSESAPAVPRRTTPGKQASSEKAPARKAASRKRPAPKRGAVSA